MSLSAEQRDDQSRPKPLLVFDELREGSLIACGELIVDEESVRGWNKLFDCNATGRRVPMGAVPLILMRAYSDLVAPRPPGNVHVGQSCTLHALPEIGQPLRTSVSCISKERRGDRLLVRFDVQLHNNRSEPMITGISTMFWGA
jgi:hypothetical protein